MGTSVTRVPAVHRPPPPPPARSGKTQPALAPAHDQRPPACPPPPPPPPPQRLNQIVEERQFARDDIMAFMSKGPMVRVDGKGAGESAGPRRRARPSARMPPPAAAAGGSPPLAPAFERRSATPALFKVGLNAPHCLQIQVQKTTQSKFKKPRVQISRRRPRSWTRCSATPRPPPRWRQTPRCARPWRAPCARSTRRCQRCALAHVCARESARRAAPRRRALCWGAASQRGGRARRLANARRSAVDRALSRNSDAPACAQEDLLWLADLMGHVHHISEVRGRDRRDPT